MFITDNINKGGKSMIYRNLIEESKRMAKALLEEFQEFYPFAHGEDTSCYITNVATSMDTDNPDSMVLIAKLKEVLSVGIDKHNFIATSICMDVQFIPEGKQDKVDGIRILLDSKTHVTLVCLIPYHFENGVINFGVEELFKDKSYVF